MVHFSVDAVAWDLPSVAAIVENSFGFSVAVSLDFQKPSKTLQNRVPRCAFIQHDSNVFGRKTAFLEQRTHQINIVNASFQLMCRVRVFVYSNEQRSPFRRWWSDWHKIDGARRDCFVRLFCQHMPDGTYRVWM